MGKNYQSRAFKERRKPDIDIVFDPGEFRPVTPYSDGIQDEYEEAQNTLAQLRQREAEIKRKADALEEITQKEEEFTRGRQEILEQIEEYLDLLDHEAIQARETAQDCVDTHQRFLAHLHNIQSMRPETWSRNNRRNELDRALLQIEAAEEVVEDSLPLIESLTGKRQNRAARSSQGAISRSSSGRGVGETDFFFWLKAGIAFSLPLMILAIFLAAVILYLR